MLLLVYSIMSVSCTFGSVPVCIGRIIPYILEYMSMYDSVF